jgi:hypothetical protein
MAVQPAYRSPAIIAGSRALLDNVTESIMPVELLLLWLVPASLIALAWGLTTWRRRRRQGPGDAAREAGRALARSGEADDVGDADRVLPRPFADRLSAAPRTARPHEDVPAQAPGAESGSAVLAFEDAPMAAANAPDAAADARPASAGGLPWIGERLVPLGPAPVLHPCPKTFTVMQTRLPLAVLLAGGLALLIVALGLSARLPTGSRSGLTLVMAVGAMASAIGLATLVGGGPPRLVARAAWWLSRRMGVSAGQLGLLLLAPWFGVLASRAAGIGVRAELPVVAWGGWLVSIGAVVAGSMKWSSERPLRFSRFEILVTVGLLVGAYLLRGTATAQLPTTFSGDEGSVGLVAAQYFRGEASNPFTIGWFSFPSFYFWLQGLSIGVFGRTIEALRIPSALAGAFTVVGVYWLARALFDRTTALLAAGLLLASHYHVHFSRVGLNNVYDGLFAVIALAGVWHGWKTGRRASFVVAGLALGLGQYFYVAIRIVPLLLVIWAGVAWCFKRERFRRRLPDMALAAFVAFVVVLPLGLYFSRFPTEFSAPLNRVTIFNGWLENEVILSGLSEAALIWGQMVKAALGFTHEPLRLLYDAGTPLLQPAMAGLFLAGVFLVLWDLRLRSLLLLLPLASVIVLSGFSQDPPASQRYIVAMPLVAILIALPLSLLYRWLRLRWPGSRQLAGVVVAMVTLALLWGDVTYYFGDVYRHYTLGGLNTEVATEVAFYLRDQPESAEDVYFFCAPRMGYFSLSTIPYLNPEPTGYDVDQRLGGKPSWALTGPTIFVFLPEREAELSWVQEAYPGGAYVPRYRRNAPGELLFSAYVVRP